VATEGGQSRELVMMRRKIEYAAARSRHGVSCTGEKEEVDTPHPTRACCNDDKREDEWVGGCSADRLVPSSYGTLTDAGSPLP
jgi:hypothetical protein